MLGAGSIWSCACACCPPALDSLVLVTRFELDAECGFLRRRGGHLAVLERRGGDVVAYGLLREVGLWWVRAWLMDVACWCVKLLGARLWRKVDLLVPLGLVELLSKVVVQRQLVGSAGVAGRLDDDAEREAGGSRVQPGWRKDIRSRVGGGKADAADLDGSWGGLDWKEEWCGWDVWETASDVGRWSRARERTAVQRACHTVTAIVLKPMRMTKRSVCARPKLYDHACGIVRMQRAEDEGVGRVQKGRVWAGRACRCSWLRADGSTPMRKCVAKVCKLAVLLRQMKEEREGQEGTKARRWSENGSLVEALPKSSKCARRLVWLWRLASGLLRLDSFPTPNRRARLSHLSASALAPRRRPLPKSGDRNQHQPRPNIALRCHSPHHKLSTMVDHANAMESHMKRALSSLLLRSSYYNGWAGNAGGRS
ncbi:hypothetical protein L1887_43284 [Cichorium endivia]|nr:hypothetical protein L1887_43284 [Cichorium endivia]